MNPQLRLVRSFIVATQSGQHLYYKIIILGTIYFIGSELVNDASRDIVIPLIASIMSIGVFLLLLVVIALIIFMSKQITNA